ncbi:ABC transporter ATP-binding protein [Photobacterium rosenbergii]|uniref:ABC transporter ATP-binding protein n=1 Tax=Photobacterium rosenbergii TaxID=294936 RepID=A0ABU3ZML3_9GAMM|nr:ABC transporter ATP-binding protein [Photobacterium rosenbergii]MDV5171359.1 ABC transporter ATP-binding protein [Photobacterium rosenbergii]
MTMLDIEGVGFGYDSKLVFDNVSFGLGQGKLVGIVGPNGGGKSTLLKLMARQLEPSCGQLRLKGKTLGSYSMKALAKQLAFLPQQPVSPAGITVEQLVQYGRHPHQGWFNQWSEEDAKQVARAIAWMKIEDLLQQPVVSLSGGQRQRAWLAMILAQDTDIILLDEPTSALDIGHQTEVMESISKMTSLGKTVVLVIHDLAAAARYCDELVALGEHGVVAAGAVEQVITKPLIDKLYDTNVDIVPAPFDGAPVIVPRRHFSSQHCSSQNSVKESLSES